MQMWARTALPITAFRGFSAICCIRQCGTAFAISAVAQVSTSVTNGTHVRQVAGSLCDFSYRTHK
jgi:hypothetical protein